ncbi:MAG TPA: CAP-associated domain-containing protein [Bacillaceae bacterium]|nr:CAP-associated domain-containing protein [Bacillaceae bacterium]
MSKIKYFFPIILLVGALWYFYGEDFKQSGINGVVNDIQEDMKRIQEHPTINAVEEKIIQQFQLWKDKFSDNAGVEDNLITDKSKADPTENQSVSMNNIRLGDEKAEIEKILGAPKRISMNEYGVNWVTYHNNYQNFIMIAYDKEDKVAGIYSNQDLLSSTMNITFESTRDVILEAYKPLTSIQKGWVHYQFQHNDEYDIFRMDGNYVTIFYDKHESNTVTAIQIISKELEDQKKKIFGEPNTKLKEGFEYQLFDLTNATRVNHGLSILKWNEEVMKTARKHSKDMAVNNYFSHTNLDGLSPFERMENDNIHYVMAGENLASGQISSIYAHEGLMNSIGHRENILQKDFEELGVGVSFNDEWRPYYTENFLKK